MSWGRYARRIRSPRASIIRASGPSWHTSTRAAAPQYVAVTDAEALDALKLLSETEGIIPALESSHAVAYAAKLAPTMRKDQVMIINLSGRGDKDMHTIVGAMGAKV